MQIMLDIRLTRRRDNIKNYGEEKNSKKIFGFSCFKASEDMIKRFKNLNFSRQKFYIALILRGVRVSSFTTLFSGPITSPRTALKRMFTFSHELTRGSVRVIYPVGSSCSVSKRLLWRSSLKKEKIHCLCPFLWKRPVWQHLTIYLNIITTPVNQARVALGEYRWELYFRQNLPFERNLFIWFGGGGR